MRATDIAFFILFINMSLSLVTTVIFPALTPIAYIQTYGAQGTNNTGSNASTTGYIIGTGDYNSSANANINLVGGAKSQAPDPITGGIMMLWTSVTFILTVFLQSLFILPVLINAFHVPIVVATIIQTIIWIAYGFGIAQWISGRSGNQLE